MALPTTSASFQRNVDNTAIELATETLPEGLNPHDVLIKIHSVSLNYRDIAILKGTYPLELEERGIPCSDCAAEVVRIGSAVQDFVLGDRVSPVGNLTNITGRENDPIQATGGNVPGVLREHAVFEDRCLVKLPKHLSWEEGATLTCAGLTAWTALGRPVSVSEGRVVLLQGTGGVSMFCLLICLAAGIQPIITSSSDEKLEEIKKLGPQIHGINYKTTSDIAAEVRRITNGRGVDIVVNNVGVPSIATDLDMLSHRGGTISLIEMLDQSEPSWSPSILTGLIIKQAKIQGILAGSKLDYQQLNQFLEEKNVSLTTLIDRVFPFKESKAAFNYLSSAKHIGKVIIKVSD